MHEDISALKEDEKEKVEGTRRRGVNNWIGGLILIALGVVFLFQNLLGFTLNNWWALFILIPAALSLGRSLQAYQRNGRFTGEARGSLIGGLLMTAVGLIFLFDLDWGNVWPVFIIIIGLSALMNGMIGEA